MSQGLLAIAKLEIYFKTIVDPVIFYLKKPIHTIGRNKDCDVIIPFQSVSRVQCTFIWRYNNGDPFYQLIDGDRDRRKPSSNGVFVNSHRVSEIWERLDHGDTITFGAASIRILYCLTGKVNPTDGSKGTMGSADE